MMKKTARGFTLIELMIVVAIIGILAAIAIPNFLRYQLRSRSAELPGNVTAIKNAQIAFHGDRETYLNAVPAPAACTNGAGVLPGNTVVKCQWTPPFAPVATEGFAAIGFQPEGAIYGQYAVTVACTVGGKNQCFHASGQANLDGNVLPQVWSYSKRDQQLVFGAGPLFGFGGPPVNDAVPPAPIWDETIKDARSDAF